MEIELKEITIRKLASGYKDSGDDGVIGYSGKLDIRPPYQREFVYEVKERNAVIDTVKKDFPLNVMYWAVRDDGNFEIIDGQQRTISICQYVNVEFSVDGLNINNLPSDKKEDILNYKLMVYFCSGKDSEKLEWFKTINIAGKELTEQELRNAVYSGSWVTDAKRYFSKRNCVAYLLAKDYISGKTIRQEYLETAIKWINNGNIEEYMSIHQHDQDAKELWEYFRNVIEWVKATFTVYRKEMKGLEWGTLYNSFKDVSYNPDQLENEIKQLMEDEEIGNQKGVYKYVLTREEKHLNLRTFSDKDKRTMFERQNGVCPICKEIFKIHEMEGDHITAWSNGGKTDLSNGQMLCKKCNMEKSNK